MPRVFNRFPSNSDYINQNYLYNQDSVKNAIFDFNKNMLDLGLIRSADNGQLDVNDIPFIPMVRKAAALTKHEYAPLIYCMTDDMQEEFPIYIKVVFHYLRIFDTLALHNYNDGDWVNNIYFTARIEICCETDGNCNMSEEKRISVECYQPNMQHFVSSYNYTTKNSFYMGTSNVEYKSNFTYNKNAGYLRVMACPGYMVINKTIANIPTYANFAFWNYTPYSIHYSCLANFVIKRLSDGSILFICQKEKPTVTSSSDVSNTYNRVAPHVYYYNDGVIYKNDTSAQESFLTFNDSSILYSNNEIGLLPLPARTLNGKVEYIHEILLTNTNNLGNNSLYNFNVNINKNKKSKYEMWARQDNGTTVISTSSNVVLLMLDENDND